MSDGATTVPSIFNCPSRRARTAERSETDCRRQPEGRAKRVKPRRPRLVTHAQLQARMGLPEFGKHLLQGVQIVGDAPVSAGLAAAPFGQGDGHGLGVDSESEKQ